MTASGRLIRLAVPSLLAGTAGYYLGISNEKNKLPFFSPASAASPSFPSNRSPVSIDSTIAGGDLTSSDILAGKSPDIISSTRHAQIMKHGYPTNESVRSFGNFVLSYNRRNRTPDWVMEHLTPESVMKKDEKINRDNCEFFEDSSIHPYFRSSNADYKSSGYDRGHLAAARNHAISQECVNQTFVLSNIAPQVGRGFNRDTWNTLEQYVRYRAKDCKNLWVCSGPLYLPKKNADGNKYISYQVIGANNVSVPTHFFKVLLIENTNSTLELESYVLENTAHDPFTPIFAFQVPVDSIERAAGFLLFDRIPKSSFKRINGKNEHLEKFMKKWITMKQKEMQDRKRA